MKDFEKVWSDRFEDESIKNTKTKVKIFFLVVMINMLLGVPGIIPGSILVFSYYGEANVKSLLIFAFSISIWFMINIIILRSQKNKIFHLICGLVTFVFSSGFSLLILFIISYYSLLPI